MESFDSKNNSSKEKGHVEKDYYCHSTDTTRAERAAVTQLAAAAAKQGK